MHSCHLYRSDRDFITLQCLCFEFLAPVVSQSRLHMILAGLAEKLPVPSLHEKLSAAACIMQMASS